MIYTDNSISDNLNRLEEKYFNTEFGNYVRTVLCKLSNNDIIIDVNDKNIINFKYCESNFNKFKLKIEKMLIDYNNIDFGDMYSDSNPFMDDDNSTKFLRCIFGEYRNLNDIIKIIEYTIEKKDSIIEYFQSIDSEEDEEKRRTILYDFTCYLNRLIYNLESLSFYMNDNIPDYEIEDIGSLINYSSSESYYDIDKELEKIDKSSISIEAVTEEDKEEKELEDAKKFRDRLKFIGSQIVKFKTMINKGKINIEHFLDKINVPRNVFYKKHLGKIDHLYKNYGSEAKVSENEVRDDPVMILTNKSGEYLSNLIEDILKIYSNYNKHISKLFDCNSFSEMISEINNYIEYDEVKLPDDAKVKNVKKAISKDLRYKVGKAILKDNEVYGHTVESIAEKKYPPIHHVMVSLFLPRPHEKAEKQPVNDIFKSADSFKIMGNKMKDIVKESSTLVNTKMKSVKIEDDYKKINNSITEFSKTLKVDLKVVDNKDGDVPNKKNSKKDLKNRLKVLRDFHHLMESFIPVFIYVANAGSVLYDICVRVDKTCQDAVKSMLNIERERTDKGYKDGTSSSKKEYKTSSNKDEDKKSTKSDPTIHKVDDGDKVTTMKI